MTRRRSSRPADELRRAIALHRQPAAPAKPDELIEHRIRELEDAMDDLNKQQRGLLWGVIAAVVAGAVAQVAG